MAWKSCPAPDVLQELLHDERQAGALAELTEHLDTCGACQRTLEMLAKADTPLPRLPSNATCTQAHPALQQAMKNLEGGQVPLENQVETDLSDASVLGFLDPSSKPGSLGRLGHYEILEIVGRGGMGVVLKGFDEKLHRVVAVKVMAPQLAAIASARVRFVREAQAAAAIRDDHVINIYAVEEANELPYLVMEFIEGVSLQQRLDRTGPLEVEKIVRIGLHVARGLAAAHAQGVIHRDIKPANILLENGVERVRITDFGLARAVDDASMTQSGVVAGTPQYMAPEQARGEPADHRADLFSLGSVLYAMCVGHAPFRASGAMAVLKRVCEDTPRSVRASNPAVPEWLEQLIEKLHAKDPAQRCQSAAEVAQALVDRIACPQSPARSPNLNPVSRPVSSRIWRGWQFAGAAVLLLCTGLAVSETTGVTQLAPTVIRIFTAEGTLLVEVEDPSVKVTIDGDHAIVITGAGLQEVRLRPGSYKVRATKDGKPVREEELITITRGDVQVVRIRREAPLAVRPVESPKTADPKPTVVVPTVAETKLRVELEGYDATLKQNPNDMAVLLKRGDVLRRLKRFADATAVFSQVIMESSNETERKSALVQRAVTHADQGRLDRTIADYEEFLRHGSEAAYVYGRLATCYTFGPDKLRNPERALEHAETAIKKRDANPSFHTLHGVCLYRVGRHREAIEVLERVYQGTATIKAEPSAMNRFFAATTYQKLGDSEKAQECYAEALKLPQPTGHPGMIPNWVELMRTEAEAVLKVSVKKK